MKKQQPPMHSKFRDPLTVFVERIGDKRVRVHGSISKETLRELLMSSLMLLPKYQQDDDKLAAAVQSASQLDGTQSNNVEDAIKTISEIYQRTGGAKSNLDKFTSVIREKVRKGLKKKDTIGEGRKIHTRERQKIAEVYGEGDLEWLYHDDRISKSDDKEVEQEERECLTTPSSLTDEVELSFDGKWLRRYLKVPLKMAMKEIVSKKPYDPVGYLGFWLLNYRTSQEHDQRRTEKDHELDHLRSLVTKPVTTDEGLEYISDGEGEEGEGKLGDWNFKNYESNIAAI